MNSLNRIFHGLLFLLHRNYLVYLIRLLDAFAFIFLLQYRGFFFLLHRISNALALIFLFCRIETLGRDFSSMSLEVDALVKGFMTLMLAIEGDEEKCSFFPLFVVGLVEEGASSNSNEGGGEKSLYGE
jgi:hypothetical protein